MVAVRLGIVTTDDVGWKTVRQRWEQDLAEYNPKFYHIEDYRRPLTGLTRRYGAKSIGDSLAGRVAAQAAIDEGANVVLMSTLQYAPLLPAKAKVRYLIYGDGTTAQLTRLFGGKRLGFPGSWITPHLQDVANHRSQFLCTSEWFRDQLRAELIIPPDQLALLPFYVDVERWKPAARRDDRPFKAVFFGAFGADFRRRGGDIVYAMAAMERFEDVEFHIVSHTAAAGGGNVRVHRQMTPDSDDLIRLVQSCHVMVLPTRADISSLAAMEASACAVPVITTRCGGIPEIVLDEITGSVLPAADLDLFSEELARYRDDASLVARRGENARRHVEQSFAKAKHVAALRALIEIAASQLPPQTERQAWPRAIAFGLDQTWSSAEA
jgi:glycosyltransferase involved in cell wall biosynthesis